MFLFVGNKKHHESPRNVRTPEKKRKSDSDRSPESVKKKIKDSDKNPLDVFKEFHPYNFFLTKVEGIPDKFNNTGAFSLKGKC